MCVGRGERVVGGGGVRWAGADLEKYSWCGKRVAGDFEGWHPVAKVCEIKMKKLKAVQHVRIVSEH